MTPDSPTDADQLVRELLAQGSESRVDYKSARPAPSEPRPRAELAKHVIGLCNRRDGGYLLIGVDDSTLVPTGLSNDEVESWDAARIHPWLATFAAPAPVIQVIRGSLEDGKVLVVLRVLPFDEQPLVCTKTISDTRNKPITREGGPLYPQRSHANPGSINRGRNARAAGPGLREAGGTAPAGDKGADRRALAG